jgi:hypothetical protein
MRDPETGENLICRILEVWDRVERVLDKEKCVGLLVILAKNTSIQTIEVVEKLKKLINFEEFAYRRGYAGGYNQYLDINKEYKFGKKIKLENLQDSIQKNISYFSPNSKKLEDCNYIDYIHCNLYTTKNMSRNFGTDKLDYIFTPSNMYNLAPTFEELLKIFEECPDYPPLVSNNNRFIYTASGIYEIVNISCINSIPALILCIQKTIHERESWFGVKNKLSSKRIKDELKNFDRIINTFRIRVAPNAGINGLAFVAEEGKDFGKTFIQGYIKDGIMPLELLDLLSYIQLELIEIKKAIVKEKKQYEQMSPEDKEDIRWRNDAFEELNKSEGYLLKDLDENEVLRITGVNWKTASHTEIQEYLFQLKAELSDKQRVINSIKFLNTFLVLPNPTIDEYVDLDYQQFGKSKKSFVRNIGISFLGALDNITPVEEDKKDKVIVNIELIQKRFIDLLEINKDNLKDDRMWINNNFILQLQLLLQDIINNMESKPDKVVIEKLNNLKLILLKIQLAKTNLNIPKGGTLVHVPNPTNS